MATGANFFFEFSINEGTRFLENGCLDRVSEISKIRCDGDELIYAWLSANAVFKKYSTIIL